MFSGDLSVRKSFDQNISMWSYASLQTAIDMIKNTSMNTYGNFWDVSTVQGNNNVDFGSFDGLNDIEGDGIPDVIDDDLDNDNIPDDIDNDDDGDGILDDVDPTPRGEPLLYVEYRGVNNKPVYKIKEGQFYVRTKLTPNGEDIITIDIEKKSNVYPDGLLRTDPFLETSGDNHTPLATKYYLPENFEQFSELVTAYKSDNLLLEQIVTSFLPQYLGPEYNLFNLITEGEDMLDLSTWDTDHIVEMNSVFSDPNILEEIYLVCIDTYGDTWNGHKLYLILDYEGGTADNYGDDRFVRNPYNNLTYFDISSTRGSSSLNIFKIPISGDLSGRSITPIFGDSMGSYRWEVGYILCKKDFIFQNTYGTDRSFRLEDNEDSTLPIFNENTYPGSYTYKSQRQSILNNAVAELQNNNSSVIHALHPHALGFTSGSTFASADVSSMAANATWGPINGGTTIDVSLDISTWELKNLQVASNLFYYTTFREITTGFKFEQLTSASNMFSNALSNFEFSQDEMINMFRLLQDGSFMFEGMSSSMDYAEFIIKSDVLENIEGIFKNTKFNPHRLVIEAPNLLDAGSMFYGCELFNPDSFEVTIPSVLNMEYMFANATTFNTDISNWNTSSVLSMKGMFLNASAFNQSISAHVGSDGELKWNTYRVEKMDDIFKNAINYNNGGQALDLLTDHVKSLAGAFLNTPFNQNIKRKFIRDANENVYKTWETPSLENLDYTFARCPFNGRVNHLNTSNVVSMKGTFMNNFEFNGDVSRWDVSNVINMESMFQSAYKFNSSLQTWDTSNVENFKQMFMNAKSFNKNINYFNISKGENLSYMLAGATSFNNGSAKGKTNNPLTLVPKKIVIIGILIMLISQGCLNMPLI